MPKAVVCRELGPPESLRLETFDWNCQQHITQRFTEQEVTEAVRPLRDRLAQLESENADLRARLAIQGDSQ